jgi:ketosteroid isomerase-like protein
VAGTDAGREEGLDMGAVESRQTVERLFQALTEHDVELFHAQFHEDSVIEFPQSGERIVGDENRRAVYRSFPGRPSVRRIVAGGDLAVVEAAVDYGDEVDWRAVFIYELRDGKIARATAYWGQSFEAAAERSEWVEHING